MDILYWRSSGRMESASHLAHQDISPLVLVFSLAKGVNRIAEEIKRLARSLDVPVIEQPPLARALYRDVPLGRPIPEKLYRAVANVLALVYRLRERRRQRGG